MGCNGVAGHVFSDGKDRWRRPIEPKRCADRTRRPAYLSGNSQNGVLPFFWLLTFPQDFPNTLQDRKH